MDKPLTGQEMKALRLHLRNCQLRGWAPCSDPEAHARAVRIFGHTQPDFFGVVATREKPPA